MTIYSQVPAWISRVSAVHVWGLRVLVTRPADLPRLPRQLPRGHGVRVGGQDEARHHDQLQLP